MDPGYRMRVLAKLIALRHLIARGVPKDGGMRHEEQTPVSWDSRHG